MELFSHHMWMVILTRSILLAVMWMLLVMYGPHLASFFRRMLYRLGRLWRKMQFYLVHRITRILLRFLH